MPRDLFGQMTRPFDGVGARSRLTVPVSLAAHVAALAMIVVVPLLATEALPALRTSLSVSMITPVVPAPPPLRRLEPPRAADVPAVNPNAAPLDAPDGFTKEVEVVPVETGSSDLGVVTGPIESSDALVPPARRERRSRRRQSSAPACACRCRPRSATSPRRIPPSPRRRGSKAS